MLETSSVHILSGILNVEWVRLPTINVAVIPDEATARAIFLSNLTFANSQIIRNVLPLSPGASEKSFPLIIINVLKYCVIKIFCSGCKRYLSSIICKIR